MCSFQCNILNNVLFLNKKQYPCIITNSLLCSFVESINETPLHLFYECNSIKSLWNKLCIFFHDMLILPLWTPQAAIFGITIKFAQFTQQKQAAQKSYSVDFTLNIYNSQKKHKLNIKTLLNNIANLKKVLQRGTRRKSQLKIVETTLAIQIFFCLGKKMTTQNRLSSIFPSKMVIYVSTMVTCLCKLIFLTYYLILYIKLQ